MTTTLNWGIIGLGNIAKTFAKGLAQSATGKLLAVASRTQEKADAFGHEFQAPRRYASYQALLEDKDIQAVYIATPHPQHAEWAIKAARAKKHILCEKPIGLNHPQAMAIIEAARENDVFLMEAFMYRCHPQTARLVELIREKAIGDVRMIQASFGFAAKFKPEGRLFANDSGGGGILDVGCYPVSMARLIAGAAAGADFADPIEVKGSGRLAPTGVDEVAAATLKFPDGIIAEVSTAITCQLENVVRIFGTEGNILVPAPWVPAREGGTVKIIVNRKGEQPREVTIETPQYLYAIEADTVAARLSSPKSANIDRRQAPSPAMSWDDTLGNMKTLDQWRLSIGLVYEQEKPQNIKPVHGGPLTVARNNMKYARIAGLGRELSRLVMGVDNVTFAPHAAVMWDDFIERGGNCFDTAWVYGGGACEKALGAWIKSRNLRKEIILLDKGAHTPFCNPKDLTRQHRESLDRLGADYVDIYMMHRDNPDYPVAEFIDVMNEHVKAGTMKVFGVSNWTIPRIEEANAYAKKAGKQGISAVSNNFSLARMVDAVWKGCLLASDPESRAWFTKTQMPLMPWSSQARGFFLDGRAHPDKKDDKELTRCWYSEDNFQRLARARELARQKGVLPINIALAYVLNQPFPAFPLIGPRLLSETHSSLPALDVQLSPDEVRWLNLEA